MAYPSGALTTFDAFTGSDGPLNPAIWGTTAYGGTPAAGVGIISNQMAPTTTAGAVYSIVDHTQNFEATVDIITATAGVGYIAWFFCMQDGDSGSWSAYWVVIAEDVWRLNKRFAGATTPEIDLDSNGPVLASGDKLGVRRLDETIEIYHYTGGAWNQTPILSTSDTDLPLAGAFAFDFQATDWRMDNLSTLELTGGVTGAVSLHVNADHPDADDDRLRSQVTADTPLRTILKAAQLARGVDEDSDDDSDEIVVWKAAAADPDNTTDPGVYAGFTHFFGLGDLPFGNNSGNKPIVMRGVDADGETPEDDSGRPRWLGFDATSLNNWQFEDLHFGYEFDSGDDVLTIKTLYTPTDLTWTRCMWTGGAYLIRNAAGLMRWEECEITAKISEFLGQGGRTLDGVGFKIVNSSESGEDFRCHFEYEDCFIHHVEGEDAFQVGTGSATQADTYIHWTRCSWEDIIQPGADGTPQNPTGIHTDCVQILGGPEYKFDSCSFRRATSCIMVSDFRNGLVHVENTKFHGSAIEAPGDAGIAMQVQGTDRLVLINNTFAYSGFGRGLYLFFKYLPSTGQTDLTFINNIFDGIWASSPVLGTQIYKNNLIGAVFGTFVMPTGNGNIQGICEFGSTDATTLELANTPAANLATDAGNNTDPLVPALDRLGRARTGSGTDIGCHESPTDPPIAADARPPYILSVTPSEGATGASGTTNVVVETYPLPTETIDAESITSTTFYIKDPQGITLPVLTRSVDTNTITLDIDGTLYPLVTYTAFITTGVADTGGNHVAQDKTWDFRVIGPAPDPAVGDFTGGGGGDTPHVPLTESGFLKPPFTSHAPEDEA